MEERGLPTIRDMYNCTRENYDYNVIRTYESPHSNGPINCKPTKRSHYLDEAIRLNCSPGPASNSPSIQAKPTTSSSGAPKAPSSAREAKSRPTWMR